MSVLVAILRKDLLIEWRNRDSVIAMALFSLLAVVVFWFALAPKSPEDARAAAPGLFWIAVLFAAFLGQGRSLARELENETLTALALAPVDRGYVFLGKALANWTLLAGVQAATAVVLAIAFSIDLTPQLVPFAGIALLGSAGVSCLGTLFAAIAVRTRYREVMLPLLALPLLIPVLLPAAAATRELLLTGVVEWASLQLLVVTDLVYLIVSFVGFEYVLDE